MNKILTDIMGTTSPNDYIKVLMANFREHSVDFIQKAGLEDLEILNLIKKETRLETDEEIVAYVNEQLQKSNLKPEYLALLGAVNVYSYKKKILRRGEFYDDVPEAFAKWKKDGKGLYVFSNGSEKSQKAMFRTAPQGDLSIYVDRFFDTATVGGKYEIDTYRRISDNVEDEPKNILFLSDLERELDAANNVGFQVMLVKRPGNNPQGGKYNFINAFTELLL